MDNHKIQLLKGFYENELTNHILSFWLPRCHDKVYGGYFNCFDNDGKQLLSHDKYTWSQGRFAWIFAKLFEMSGSVFSKKEREQFLSLSKDGCEFLMAHCLIAPDDYRCVYLMDETGAPKQVEQFPEPDMSIYADCFVVAALARYAKASGEIEKYRFAKRLYNSCMERVRSGHFNTLPYPLSKAYRAHGIPMILTNVTSELFRVAQKLDPEFVEDLKKNLAETTDDVLTHFADCNNFIHEVISEDNQFFDSLLGQHINPGHSIEDSWFMIEAADILNHSEWLPKIFAIAKKTLEIGWDTQYGGLLHYCALSGQSIAEQTYNAQEPMLLQVLSGWSDKLWWVHSEALYTTLLCYQKTGDSDFLRWHDSVFDYTFSHFPNPDQEIREWRQILHRDGTAQNKVVALPVKDPYHIIRNFILILELLYSMEKPS